MAFNNEFTQVENSWQPAGTTRPNNFTTQQTFTGNYTSNFPIQINAGNVSQVEPNIYNTSPSFTQNNGIQVQGYDSGGSNAQLIISFYTANTNAQLALNRCNGTYASKTGILNNNALGAVNFYGMKTTQTNARFAGGWQWNATEDWGTSNHGSQAIVTVYRNVDGASRSSYIRNDGVWEPGYGIRFGTAGLSVLSTYEEGTWTPVVSSTGATFSVNGTETVGRYVRIGKMIFVEFAVQLSGATTGTTTNQVNIAGMPYASQTIGTGHNHRPVLIGESFTTTATSGLVANLIASTAFNVAVASTTGGTSPLTAGTFSGSGARITGAFSYQVA